MAASFAVSLRPWLCWRHARNQLYAAGQLEDLRIPPGNRLEALKGDRKGQHSIRINDQWRICFIWKDGGAELLKLSITTEEMNHGTT